MDGSSYGSAYDTEHSEETWLVPASERHPVKENGMSNDNNNLALFFISD